MSNPWIHNANRKHNRRIDREVRRVFTIRSDRGRIARKRKKHVYRVERAAYRDLLESVMRHLINKANNRIVN